MQGLCGFDETFTAVVCKHVGSANDADCFETCNLKEINESLPFPYHWNGDPAYTLSETMMVPYAGLSLHIHDPAREALIFIIAKYESLLSVYLACSFNAGKFSGGLRSLISIFSWKLFTAVADYITLEKSDSFLC